VIALVPVRDGLPILGAGEAVAEAGGRALLVGSGTAAAVESLPASTSEVALAEVGEYRPAAWAEALASILEGEALILLPASPDGRDLAPRLAVRLRRPLAAGVLRLGEGSYIVPLADHRSQAEVSFGGPLVATIEPGARSFPAGPPRAAAVRTVTLQLGAARDAEVLEVLPADPATIDLSEADRIIAGGIGLGLEEHFRCLSRVGGLLRASVGATRPAVDAGWAGFSRQIGTTGALVTPVLYFAVGISGAVQHTSGLGNPTHIISVNTDASCPMMQLADLAVVADGPATLAELERLLGEEAAGEA
jgi:electron transfer flavoprotein alpha subunit